MQSCSNSLLSIVWQLSAGSRCVCWRQERRKPAGMGQARVRLSLRAALLDTWRQMPFPLRSIPFSSGA